MTDQTLPPLPDAPSPHVRRPVRIHQENGRAALFVDDLDIASTVTDADISLRSGGVPAEITLRLTPADFAFLGDQALLKVDDATRTALLKLGWTPPCETATSAADHASAPRPEHLGLGDLIARLEREHQAHPGKRVRTGFHQPQCYRGYYSELAFEVTHDVAVKDMLDTARQALGATFQGWKGGDYTMRDYTQVWLIPEPGDCGESLGAILLEHLLAQEVPA